MPYEPETAPQRPSKHGNILGTAFAKLADRMEPLCPTVPERCKTCAFRSGTIPNQMAGTLVEAMHCVIGTDPSPFCCHQSLRDGEPTHLCAGYVLVKKARFEEVRSELANALTELSTMEDAANVE